MKWLNDQPQYNDDIIKAEQILKQNLEHYSCKNVTFQLTEECNCACTYCYQCNKSEKYMSIETGRGIVDYLISLWESNSHPEIIDRDKTIGVILDFIGGEPLLNIDVMYDICEYFWNQCIIKNIPWANNWCASISSNGSKYFDPRFQKFLNDFKGHVSYGITVDGPKEIHDACRIYKDGSGGNFDDAYEALLHYKKNYQDDPGTKITIAPENLKFLNTTVKFFFDNDIKLIHGNVVFEHEWSVEEGREFYQQLKDLADYILSANLDSMVGFFNESQFCPMSEDNNQNWCGGTGAMLAFDPDGVAYPCLRYMKSSLGNSRQPIILGNYKDGIPSCSQECSQILQELSSIDRRSQSTDECFYCPIANGCAWCSAWNYQETGTVNCRSTRICNAHKSRSLANVYFWNKYYLQEGITKYFHRYLPDEEALKFVSKEELKMLDDLEREAKSKTEEYPDESKN